MSTERLVLPRALDLEVRGEFIAEAIRAIESAATSDSETELDCATVEDLGTIDDAVIGMLVTLARAAKRHGARVALVKAPNTMRPQLEAAGVAHFFNWKR